MDSFKNANLLNFYMSNTSPHHHQNQQSQQQGFSSFAYSPANLHQSPHNLSYTSPDKHSPSQNLNLVFQRPLDRNPTNNTSQFLTQDTSSLSTTLLHIKKLFNNKQYEAALEGINYYLNPTFCPSEKDLLTEIALLQMKGECLLHLNRTEEFFRCQDEIFARDQSETKAMINKGSIYFQLKRFKESLQEFTKYVGIVKSDANAYYLKGLVEEKLKHYEAALISFDASLALNTNQIKVMKKRTPLLATLGRSIEAIENQKRVLIYLEQNVNRQNSKLLFAQYLQMAKLYFAIGSIDESYAFLEKSLAQKSDHSETYFYLGECFQARGETVNAIECFEKAALYDSNNTAAITRRDELMSKIEEEESPQKYPSHSDGQPTTDAGGSLSVIEEEDAPVITLDDIRKDIENLERAKTKQTKEIKANMVGFSEMFEFESTRTLVQQYQLNLAPYKTFLKVQDHLERMSMQSNNMRSSIRGFKPFIMSTSPGKKDSHGSDKDSAFQKLRIKDSPIYSSSKLFRFSYSFRQ